MTATTDHPEPHLAHHFDTPAQQFESGRIGLWAFLVTEILMFSGLFLLYAVYRANHYDMFVVGSAFLDTHLGALNTILLLLSSFTMAWAVRAAQLNQQRATVVLLALTLMGAGGFMAVKYIEYSHKLHLGLGPGNFFQPDEQLMLPDPALPDPDSPAAPPPPAGTRAADHGLPHTSLPAPAPSPVGLSDAAARQTHFGPRLDPHTHLPRFARSRLVNARPFFSIYFAMTGLHGLHVLVGMGLIAWLCIRAARGHFSSRYYTPVDFVGLYWHLVDMIWIFLFPLLYLIH